nr:hypothetical protein [Tanacetum cinerariifolium]
MYSVDLKNIVPKGGLTCLFAKATSDESKLWHRWLGHLNFKTMNKLVKENLDETSAILKTFITGIENLVDHKVKVIRCNNGTEFKNREMNKFCEMKEAVNTACYVQNRVLVVKPHKKTLYELFHGRTPSLSFMRPFGCLVTILNTKDHLGKFDGKADEGFFVRYSLHSKAFRVFNSRTRIVEENLHIRCNENTPNVVGSGPDWLFDIDALTRTMNYEPIVVGTQSNNFIGSKASDNAGQAREEKAHEDNVNNINTVNAAGTNRVNTVGGKTNNELPSDLEMPALEDISTFNFSSDHEGDDEMADMNNLDTTIQVSPNTTTRIHKDDPLDQLIRDLHSTTQTRNMSKNLKEHGIEDPDFPNKVYKVEKALYGLHQALRAGASKETLSKKNHNRSIITFTFLIYLMAKNDENTTNSQQVPPTQQASHTLSTIKLPILKKGEYAIWAMKIEHYLEHTDYPIWEVIQKGNGSVQVSTDTNGQIRVLPPKTTKEILARERERKERTTLLMDIPEDRLAKFHKMTDAKEMFQSLLSQLETHGSGVSTEGANQKFLRSLPSSWSQVSLIMRTKPGVDTLNIDDLYNNLRVFESDVKGSTGSSSSTQNVAFVSSNNTSSTNEVNNTFGVSTSSGHNSQKEGSSSYTDDL